MPTKSQEESISSVYVQYPFTYNTPLPVRTLWVLTSSRCYEARRDARQEEGINRLSPGFSCSSTRAFKGPVSCGHSPAGLEMRTERLRGCRRSGWAAGSTRRGSGTRRPQLPPRTSPPFVSSSLSAGERPPRRRWDWMAGISGIAIPGRNGTSRWSRQRPGRGVALLRLRP
jgi:hypothetical protein